jgi:hypothetical protein
VLAKAQNLQSVTPVIAATISAPQTTLTQTLGVFLPDYQASRLSMAYTRPPARPALPS